MSNIIFAAFAIALILGGALTLTNASLTATSDLSYSWDQMVDRKEDKARTELTLISADFGATPQNVDISLRNTGQTALKDFSLWDVILQYYKSSGNADLSVLRLTYSTSDPPPDTMWTVEGIYLDISTLTAEVFEPNVFNPGEEMFIRLRFEAPPIPGSTDNLAKIGATNGVTLSAPFSR